MRIYEREQVLAELLYMKRDYKEDSSADKTLDAVIVMLTELEPFAAYEGDCYSYRCPKCYTLLFHEKKRAKDNDREKLNHNYCGKCGQAVKWE